MTLLPKRMERKWIISNTSSLLILKERMNLLKYSDAASLETSEDKDFE